MKRVASLYLPDWPIERIVLAQAGHTVALPDEGVPHDSDAIARYAEYGRRRETPSDADFARKASPPSIEGWRPGARWARSDSAHPFKPMPPDEGRAPLRDSRTPAQAGAQGNERNVRNPGLLPAQEHTRTGTISTPFPPEQKRREDGLLAIAPHTRVTPSPVSGRTCPRHVLDSAGRCPPDTLPKRGDAISPHPLVTSIQQGNRLVIAAASPAARALGIGPAMAVTQARALVPGLDIRPADPAGDRAALRDLAIFAARRWCPLVALSGDGPDDWGLFLDITGTAHLFGGEARMMRRIVRLLARAGFTARVAVADTVGAAWALARHDPQLCAPGAHGNALAPLPTNALRLDSRAIDLLKRLGVETIGQLAVLPRAPLARRFGGRLIARLDQASGRLPEPLTPIVPPEHIAVVQRFAEPIATAEAIEHWLGVLMPRLVTALAQAGLGARTVELVADRIDGVPQRLRIGLARPTRDTAHLLRLTVRRIEEIAPGYGIDALALHVRRADPLGAQAFAETLEDRTPTLAPLIDTLANRIGPERLWRMAPVESDVPERSLRAMPPLDPPERATVRLKRDDVRHLDARPVDHPWHPRWPRPPRLLRRPEAIDHVLVELPDHAPKRFTWRGETHRVVRADGPERIAGEWWQRPSERHSIRDYFHVEDDAGQRFWLFRRGDGERGVTGDLTWFVHGSFG